MITNIEYKSQLCKTSEENPTESSKKVSRSVPQGRKETSVAQKF